MQVEQAVFTSAQTERAQGYHLVARSPGIDDDLAQQLAIWGPTQNALVDPGIDAQSLNAFPIRGDGIALSRSIYAGSEYSARGEFRLETNILVLQRSQLRGYQNDPLSVIRAARALGHLRLRAQLAFVLPAVELPAALGTASAPSSIADVSLIDDVAASFRQQRLVLVGVPDPQAFLRQVLHRLPPEQRCELSFSTGLKPSVNRPFSLQFLSEVTGEVVRELEARGIRCLKSSQPTVA